MNNKCIIKRSEKKFVFIIIIFLVLFLIGSVISQELRVTGEHPFYSPDAQDWVKVKDLSVGDKLLTADGEVVVIKKITNVVPSNSVKVYNMQVGDVENYYAEEVLVHNKAMRANRETELSNIFRDEERLTPKNLEDGVLENHISKISGPDYAVLINGENIVFYYNEEVLFTAKSIACRWDDIEVRSILFLDSSGVWKVYDFKSQQFYKFLPSLLSDQDRLRIARITVCKSYPYTPRTIKGEILAEKYEYFVLDMEDKGLDVCVNSGKICLKKRGSDNFLIEAKKIWYDYHTAKNILVFEDADKKIWIFDLSTKTKIPYVK